MGQTYSADGSFLHSALGTALKHTPLCGLYLVYAKVNEPRDKSLCTDWPVKVCTFESNVCFITVPSRTNASAWTLRTGMVEGII